MQRDSGRVGTGGMWRGPCLEHGNITRCTVRLNHRDLAWNGALAQMEIEDQASASDKLRRSLTYVNSDDPSEIAIGMEGVALVDFCRVPEQTQLQPASSAAKRTMTCGRVAAKPAQQWCNVSFEIDDGNVWGGGSIVCRRPECEAENYRQACQS